MDDRSHRSLLSLALRAGAVAVVLALIGLLVRQTLERQEGPHFVAAIKADEKPIAPAFNLPVIWRHAATWPQPVRTALSDDSVSLEEMRGYPVVMNFWASWCVPCKAEAPRLVASAQAHQGKVVVLGVDVQDFESDARRFLTRYKTNYVSVRDGGDSTYSAYGLTGLPETYFLDAGGRVLAHEVGEMSSAELGSGISAAIAGSRQ